MSKKVEATKKWWKESDETIHQVVFGVIRSIDTKQAWKNDDDLKYLRMYGNLEIAGLNVSDYTRSASSDSQPLTLNIVQNMCDTVTNKIAKNKPRVSFMTSNGSGTQMKKAKQLTKFIDGMFYQQNFYEKAQKSFKDGTIFGTGAIKFFIRDCKVVTERTFPNELVVDTTQAIHGEPREIYQRKYVSRDYLIAQFPEYADKLSMTPTTDAMNYKPLSEYNTEQLLVVEAWHLPSGKDKKDGKHVMVVENCTLVSEKWKKEYFPFVFQRWNERPLGFWGQGLAEQLLGSQKEVNRLLRTVQISMSMMSVPRVFVEEGSKVVSAHINDKIGNIIKYKGKIPEFSVSAAIHPDVLNQIDRIYSRSYEIAGVSQLSAQSKKPDGIDSAVAMREYNDIESDRFVLVGQRYENFYVNSAKIMIDLAKDIYEEEGEYQVKLKGKKFVETIKWSDINVEEDDYIMQPFPVSGLGNTPTGRLQKVQELINGNFIPREEALDLLDMPDLEKYMSLEVAGIRNIYNTIDKIVDDGNYTQPEPYQNLVYGIKRFQAEYLMCKDNGLEEDRLEMLRTWIEQAKYMMDSSMQQAQAQQMQQAQAMEAQSNPQQADQIEVPGTIPQAALTQ